MYSSRSKCLNLIMAIIKPVSTFPMNSCIQSGRVAQSVQRLATGWTVRGSNPGGGEIFYTCLDRLWGPTSLLYNGYRVFPGGKKWPASNADPSPPSSTVAMKE